MRNLASFLVVTVDGYNEGPNQEFDWPNVGDEFNEFAIEQLDASDPLKFARATYGLMDSTGQLLPRSVTIRPWRRG